MPVPKVVLTISGFDPCSGAGITADVKTAAAHGCYGAACITALTVQSTVAVRRVVPVSGDIVRQTFEELTADLPIAAVRIGMLGSGEVAEAVAECLARGGVGAVVLDPILLSSSGAELLDPPGVEVLKRRLLPLATVVTPNLDEASALTGVVVRNLSEMKLAAEHLHRLGARAVVVKGGHLKGAETLDLLSVAGQFLEFRGPRLQSTATHGTGCAFATALACNLARGAPLEVAVGRAKSYVSTAIAQAYPLGRGRGPMNHLFRCGCEEELT
jgi:hydroxymethylpyrimidine/phosphomethylpyrimidine kinase